MSNLSAILAPKTRNKKGEKDAQYNGVKLSKEHVAELYRVLGVELDTAGSVVLDRMIAEVTGEPLPEESQGSTDGSKFIGKKMSIKPSEDATVFDSHLKLCEALNVPATTAGADMFRVILEAFLKKTGNL